MEKFMDVFKGNIYIALVVFSIIIGNLFITKTTFYKGRPWLIISFFTMLYIAIFGGLLLAYFDIQKLKITEVKPPLEQGQKPVEPDGKVEININLGNEK
jgi:hypothetical protein